MSDKMMTTAANHITMTAEIVSAYVSANHLQTVELLGLIGSVHAIISALGKPVKASDPAIEKATPAQIRKSVTPDALISFIDGKPYKMLKRHLTRHNLNPISYRTRYGLPADYPMTAATYSEKRAAISKAVGLGGKPAARERAAMPDAAEATPEAPKRRGRAVKAAA